MGDVERQHGEVLPVIRQRRAGWTSRRVNGRRAMLMNLDRHCHLPRGSMMH